MEAAVELFYNKVGATLLCQLARGGGPALSQLVLWPAQGVIDNPGYPCCLADCAMNPYPRGSTPPAVAG